MEIQGDRPLLSFGRLLGWHLETKNCTVKEFSAAVGVSARTVHRWVKGLSAPKNLSDIEEALFGAGINHAEERQRLRHAYIALKFREPPPETISNINNYFGGNVPVARIEGETFLGGKGKEAWAKLEQKFKANEIVEGIILNRLPGGDFTVALDGLAAMLPGDQIDIPPIKDDVTPLMNVPQPFHIVVMDRDNDFIVVSRRLVLEELLRRSKTIAHFKEGQVVGGVVKRIINYGAFIDIGGIDGLLHIKDMAWDRVNHPTEIMNVGDKVKVQIIHINAETQRIRLGIKQLATDPFQSVASLKKGDTVTCEVVGVTDHGINVRIGGTDVTALIRRRDISRDRKAQRPERFIAGEIVNAVVTQIDKTSRKIGLSIKALELAKEEESYDGAFTPRPSTFTFSLKEGRIGARPVRGNAVQPEIASGIHLAVKEKAIEASERFSMSNAPVRVRNSLERLLAALGEGLSDVQPGVLLMRFRTIEADILAYSSPSGRLELGEDALASLADLSASIEDLMACYPELTILEAERLAQRLQDKDIPTIMGHMADMLAAAENSDVVLPSAQDALSFGNDIIQNNNDIIESISARNDEVVAAIQSRAKIIGQKLLDYRNFAARVLLQATAEVKHAGGVARRELAGVAADSWKEMRKSIPKGIGKGAGKAAEKIVPGAFAVLVTALAGPLVGIGVLMPSVAPLGRRAQEISTEQEQEPEDHRGDIPRSSDKQKT